MTDFETPIMRDISKLMPPLLLGMLIAIGLTILFLVPFSMTVYGENCSVTTSYTIAKWIVRSLTIQC